LRHRGRRERRRHRQPTRLSRPTCPTRPSVHRLREAEVELPGGKAVLYTKHVGGTQFETANLAVSSLAGGAPKIVVRGGDYGRYVPSGHLLYDAEHDG